MKRVATTPTTARATRVKLLATTAAAVAPARLSPSHCLLDLDGSDLVRGVVVRRPSARNKSPYVGDVRLADGREVIAHMPSMDMGGKCRPGVAVLMRPARDKKGALVGAEASGQYGTPKCEFILQLLRVEEPENAALGGVWIGAHPSIGEKIAQGLVMGGLLSELPAATEVQREVTGVAGTDMRCDFLLSHAEEHKGTPRRTVLEVKTVVDTDYDPVLQPAQKDKEAKAGGKAPPTFLGRTTPYERAGIFPWGRCAQKGPEGERVVSARAIKARRLMLEPSTSGASAESALANPRALSLFSVGAARARAERDRRGRAARGGRRAALGAALRRDAPRRRLLQAQRRGVRVLCALPARGRSRGCADHGAQGALGRRR